MVLNLIGWNLIKAVSFICPESMLHFLMLINTGMLQIVISNMIVRFVLQGMQSKKMWERVVKICFTTWIVSILEA